VINAQPTLNLSSYQSFRVKQNGLVLIVTLLALLILLLASVALIRSTDTNLQIAGNMAFKMDAMNQAERAVPQIQQLFKTGALSGKTARYQNSTANNYYATVQASNESGIPNVLFTTNTNQITGAGGVTIRYVIDRMCLDVGAVSTQKCALASSDVGGGGGIEGEFGSTYPVYRMTLQATGPKNTEAYLQATFSD
jgi:type IV pilus assembly protein PilX